MITVSPECIQLQLCQIYVIVIDILDDPASLNHFNGNFVSAWRRTDSFKTWSENIGTTLQNLDDIPATHPCVGQLSVGDVKLRLTQ